MLSIHTAVNRETKGGAVLGPDQRISTLEAVRAYTSYAALFSHSEAWRGTIEPGKVADFVIPSEDILEAPAGRLKGITPSPRPSWTTGSCTGSFLKAENGEGGGKLSEERHFPPFPKSAGSEPIPPIFKDF